MPRLARLGDPGVLHHIIIRGIERRKTFRDDRDRENFLDRLGKLLPETKTACYAWTFLANHAHFLMRTGEISLATVMRSLLTGYAVSFNRRYKRHGHLFPSPRSSNPKTGQARARLGKMARQGKITMKVWEKRVTHQDYGL